MNHELDEVMTVVENAVIEGLRSGRGGSHIRSVSLQRNARGLVMLRANVSYWIVQDAPEVGELGLPARKVAR